MDEQHLAKIPEKERQRILRVRHNARTDLLFLCNEILHYKDVNRQVHFPVLNIVQNFDHIQGEDTLLPSGSIFYEPRSMEPGQVFPIEDARRRLILDPRGFLKTTINIIAHSIQWIINFPDVAILLVHASEGKAIDILSEIRGHFTGNPTFRYYFPEFCPQSTKDIRNFGNSYMFRVPNRRRLRKEPTITVGSVDKKMASAHYHVIKFTDVVEEQNAATEEQRHKVAQKFGQARFLLIDAHHWIDVEGTRYHMGDLYGQIIRNQWFKIMDAETGEERDRLPEERDWKMSIRGGYKKIGVEKEFTPDFLDAPYALDEKGRRIPWWPTWKGGIPKFDLRTLEAMRLDPTIGESQFASQILNNPLDTSAEKTFPLNLLRWVKEEAIARIPTDFYITSVDTASTTSVTSNDTCITTCKWDTYGRQIVVEISLGKYQPDEIVKEVFVHVARYKPMAVFIEETEFVRGFKANFMRLGARLNLYPNFEFLVRDTHISKIDRIEKTLQPPYKHGFLRFSTGLPDHVKERLKVELSEFPLSSRDDILDTLADQYQGRRDNYAGRKWNRPMTPERKKHLEYKNMERALTEMIFGDPQEDYKKGSTADLMLD